jgi:hypothetical protein
MLLVAGWMHGVDSRLEKTEARMRKPAGDVKDEHPDFGGKNGIFIRRPRTHGSLFDAPLRQFQERAF